MNIQAIYHKGDSEDAYIFPEAVCNIRIKTGKEIKKVTLLFGEPFDYQTDDKGNWSGAYEVKEMKKVSESKLFAYWSMDVRSDTKRLQYGFLVHEDENANFDELPDEKFIKNEIPDSSDKSLFYGINGPLKISKQLITSGSQFFKMPYFQEADMVISPEWTYYTKWYQVIVDRFYKAGGPWKDNAGGDQPYNFFGGNLKGLQEKLPYIKELGFNGLYMCPIFTSPSIHKYNTEDYFEVDPQYGTKEDLKNLIDAAHEMDMRVMLEGAFNPDVQDSLISVGQYWAREFNIDGWRLDAAD
ncbi:MAG: alpha amylase N-terminal ig-like domain-containing protein, partial [Bifidobacteriaceae bacterium]|nr:alpha amylase N-terminal ig-like domain-containing protein [Bifidobacteriaceae bacterium]